MELKVWVDGVVRVVCGLSEDTSCQDVVIALAQAIGERLLRCETIGSLCCDATRHLVSARWTHLA